MTRTDLVDAMRVAADAVAAELVNAARPAPARTWSEFREVFAKIDDRMTTLLRSRLDGLVPGVAWLEDETRGGTGWYCDVTDGAVQYLQGLPQWCVTISYLDAGRAVATVLRAGEREDTYAAVEGAGATRNGQSIAPSRKTDPGVCIVATNHPPFVVRQPEAISATAAAVGSLLPLVGAVRSFGPTSWQIADTASGRIDAFVEYGRDPENLVGAALVAREAGLVVEDGLGGAWTPESTAFIAAPPQLYGVLAAALAAASGIAANESLPHDG